VFEFPIYYTKVTSNPRDHEVMEVYKVFKEKED